MTMAASGVAKLIEECGELQQVLGKKLAYWYTNDHPDGGKPLNKRIEDEMADVQAAIDFCSVALGLDRDRIRSRVNEKWAQFWSWENQTDNNDLAIDGDTARTIATPQL